MKIVGVLGGTGAIGSRTVNLLKRKYCVHASYRTRKRESEEGCVYTQVDMEDVEAVRQFISQCDAIVNCAGASYLNGETVARIAGELKIPYVDPSGEAFLEEKIAVLEKQNVFVLSSGYFPGMSGLMMRHICASFDKPENISGLSVSEEVPSQSAIEDFILTNLSGFGSTLCYYNNGRIEKDSTEQVEIIHHQVYKFQNYLSVEAERIGKEFALQRANWYNASFGEEIVRKLQEAVISLKQGTDSYKEIIKEVICLFEKKLKDALKFTYIKIEGQGITNGRRLTKRIEMESSCSSEISAIIAASAVDAVLEKERKAGIYYAMDLIDSSKIIDQLPELNVQIKLHEVEERKEVNEYEEGSI